MAELQFKPRSLQFQIQQGFCYRAQEAVFDLVYFHSYSERGDWVLGSCSSLCMFVTLQDFGLLPWENGIRECLQLYLSRAMRLAGQYIDWSSEINTRMFSHEISYPQAQLHIEYLTHTIEVFSFPKEDAWNGSLWPLMDIPNNRIVKS